MRDRLTRLHRVLIVFVVAALALSACDWAQFRGDAARSGTTSQPLVDFAGTSGIVEKWSAVTGGPVRSSPVVANDVVYAGSDAATFSAYDATTGAPKWSRTTGGAIAGAAAIDGGVAYIGSADNTLYAYDAATGAPKWARVIDAGFGGVASSPAVAGGRVFVSSSGAVYAVTPADGTTLWSTPLAGPLSPPAVAGDLLYVSSYTSGTVTALHVADGTVAWSVTIAGTRAGCLDVAPAPAVAEGAVYAPLCPSDVDAHSLFAFDAATGDNRWGAGDAAYSTAPSFAKGKVFVASGSSQTLESRLAADGSLIWAGPLGGSVSSAPTVAAGTIYIGADDGRMRGFDVNGQNRCGGTPRTCQPIWTDATGGPISSSPAISDGFLYVGSDDKALHAYSLPAISFSKSRLQNVTLSLPTVARFGPDHRLYVGQYNGQIKALTVTRNGIDSYRVTSTETINLIRSIPNHNDDGTLNPTVATRLITGLAVTGTAASPVVYVSSSDPRVGGGTQGTVTNLDTNSGVISRLTRTGATWTKQDVVRGLPRSEENHATNAIAVDSAANVLYVGQGGNTNMGAPSHNFNFLPEYAYSAAVLRVDLAAIGTTTYDLPTLIDEDHPGLVGPFGGNGGKHQAKLTTTSPVQIYTSGFRNPFAVVRTHLGKLYAVNNGPNAGWGGVPAGEGPAGNCSNAARELGVHDQDSLHLLSAGYYGGHPNPTRANRGNKFNTTNPQSPVPASHAVECDYRDPTHNGSLAVLPSGTTGMAEYTAANLGNQLFGDLLVGSVGGTVYRIEFDAKGTSVVSAEPLFSNLGGYAMDVAVEGNGDPQPGTVWVPNLQLNTIDVFEPSDYGGRAIPPCSGANSSSLDEDRDGYANADEIANGTEPCSSADAPHDWDHDLVSDLRDNDDDNDGIADTADAFAVDANNGLATNVPIAYPFVNGPPSSPCAPTPTPSGCPGGIIGLGFSGLMNNGVTGYQDAFDPHRMTVGGAAGVLTVDQVPAGTARDGANSQQFAFQYGVRAPDDAFTVHSQVLSPFSGGQPSDGQAVGAYVGTGDQDNSVALFVTASGGAPELQVVTEVDGVSTAESVPLDLTGVTAVDLFLTVDKAQATVTARARLTTNDGPGALVDVGAPQSIPSVWLEGSTRGVALGLIATSAGAAPFPVTWSALEANAGPPI